VRIPRTVKFQLVDSKAVSFPLQLKAYSEPVDARLRQLLPSVEIPPTELHAAMRYSCLAPGKRLRPVLCMAAASSLGVGSGSVIDAACAIEMVHCFSLIHDDLPAIDNDDLRRGVPTLHVKYGEALAILAGDALFALALQTLASSPHEPAQVVRAVQRLTVASGSDGLVGGEVADVLSEGKAADRQTLAFIHSRKTGALIAASCEIGGILAGGSEPECAGLKRYGDSIGLAFQIADDVLNETSTPEQLGKAAGSDRERRKATYPSLYGVEESRRLADQAVEEALSSLGERPDPFLSELAKYAVERLH
jgi:geranylgeranyl diphosphate synthase, type II